MHNQISEKWSHYPEDAQTVLQALRLLIFDIAKKHQLGAVTEELKWGQASFRVESGSPVRMDWAPEDDQHCCLYFHCQTKLVDTFRELYSDSLNFAGNRAIVLPLNQPLPHSVVSHCLLLALTYKRVKHLPLLGA
jgi:hypothetical protein